MTILDPRALEDMAALLWRTEVEGVGAPASVAQGRTREAFDEQSDVVKDNWRKFARAALSQPQAGEPVAVGYVDPADTARKSSVGEPLRFWCSPVKTTCFSMPLYASPQPAKPAQVTDAMVEAAILEFAEASYALGRSHKCSQQPERDRAAEVTKQLTNLSVKYRAAIGAGGQALDDDLLEDFREDTVGDGQCAFPKARVRDLISEIDRLRGVQAVAVKPLIPDAEKYISEIDGILTEGGLFRGQAMALQAAKVALSQPHPADERVVEALRSDEHIVEQTERLARIFLQEAVGTGYEAPEDHVFHAADDPRSRKAWLLACIAQEELTQTDPNDAVTALSAKEAR